MFLAVADAPLFDAVRPSRGVVTLAGATALVVLMGLSAFLSPISGFVFNRAGRLVEEGETFRFENVEIHIESVEQTRIKRVRIEQTEPTELDGDRPEIGA
ncbi:transporter associated domain-containing protein [Halopelagius fulvigenes]|uniref:Transporter associated domain-containing protein n=1 Tax=Halopelagius fulvigenes TaxID=1198324 RepID=A0ABD5TYZ0_9EURY